MRWITHPCPYFNTLRPSQNGRLFADDIFKWIFLNENVWFSIMISLKFVPKGPIINISALVQIMAWRRAGDKALSEPMMVSLLTHICVTRPQWVKGYRIQHEWIIALAVGHGCKLSWMYPDTGQQITILCLLKLSLGIFYYQRLTTPRLYLFDNSVIISVFGCN